MGKAHPVELQARVAAFGSEGHWHRETARHLRVSLMLVNDLIRLRRPTGHASRDLKARATGAARGEITLEDMTGELADVRGITIHRGSCSCRPAVLISIASMAFPKLKARLGKAAARTCDALLQTVGRICDPFTDEVCCKRIQGSSL